MTIGDKVGQAGSMVREKAAAARSRASTMRSSGAGTIDESPALALVGGLVLGAIAAAVLPRTQKETQLLAPVGGKISQSAKSAVQAARDASQSKLDELGINKESIGGAVKNLASSAAGAAKQAASGGGSSGSSGGGLSGATGGSSSLEGTRETSTSSSSYA